MSISCASWTSVTSVVPNVAAGAEALPHDASSARQSASAMDTTERERLRGVTNLESSREFREDRSEEVAAA